MSPYNQKSLESPNPPNNGLDFNSINSRFQFFDLQ